MANRNVVLTETQCDLGDRLMTLGRYQDENEALRSGLQPFEREEAELVALRDRLMADVEKARSGEFSDRTGEDSIRRAFARARTAQ